MKRIFLVAGIVTLFTLGTASAVEVGQIDTFQDGTTQNWRINLLGMGNLPPGLAPQNIPSGGPSGAGDSYLQLNASGNPGAGGRLTAINFMGQWVGDYLSSGISGIALDVNNLGSSDLSLRLLFEDPQLGPPENVAISQNPILVPAGSGWQSIFFPIGTADLVAVDGTVEGALENTTALRIFHSAQAADSGDPILATLGVDNIRATPESGSTLLLLLGGSLSVGLLNSRRQAVR